MGYYTIRKIFFVDCYTSNVEQSQKIDKFLALLDRSGACDLLNSLLKEKQKNGKWTTYEKFSVTKMDIVDGKIVALNIASDKTGKIVYSFGYTRNVANEGDAEQEQKPNIEALKSLLDKNGIRMETVFELYKIKSEEEITASKYANIIKNLDKIKQKQDEKEIKHE